MANLNLFQVKSGTLEAVVQDFGKTITDLDEDVQELKQWMKSQSHLPEIMNEKCIQNILLINKWKMEKTKQKLEMYYSIRLKTHHIFNLCNPKLPSMKRFMEQMYFVPLPELTDDMYRVFIFKVRNKDELNDIDTNNVMRQMVNLQEIRIHEDVAWGDIFVYDFAHFPLSFYLKLTPRMLYNTAKIYERFFSSRVKGMYLFNIPRIMEKVLLVVKLVMKQKLFSRIYTCKNGTLLSDILPGYNLPKDYGGTGKSLEELQEALLKKFAQYQNRFDKLDQLLVKRNQDSA